MHRNTHRQSPKHPVGWVIITFRDQVSRSKLKKLGLIHEIDVRGPVGDIITRRKPAYLGRVNFISS